MGTFNDPCDAEMSPERSFLSHTADGAGLHGTMAFRIYGSTWLNTWKDVDGWYGRDSRDMVKGWRVYTHIRE